MNDLEIMKSYCDKCKHKGTCINICPTVWFAVLQKEKEQMISMISKLTDRLRTEAKSIGTYETDYMAKGINAPNKEGADE